MAFEEAYTALSEAHSDVEARLSAAEGRSRAAERLSTDAEATEVFLFSCSGGNPPQICCLEKSCVSPITARGPILGIFIRVLIPKDSVRFIVESHLIVP